VDGAAEIRVADTGEGIAPEIRERIFDLFVQGGEPGSRGRDGGLGVGLALVRRVAELHGGSVTVSSAGPGRGAEFCVRVPLAVHDAPAPEASPEPPRDRPRTILLVDDDPSTRSSMCKLFEYDGIAAKTAAGGQEVLAALAGAPAPDLILLDIGLPGMDGYEVCRRIRGMTGGPELVIFALTGFGQDSDRHAAECAGFDGHLTKPVDVDEIYRVYAERGRGG
jgi:CheY-like chemotaxis protein